MTFVTIKMAGPEKRVGGLAYRRLGVLEARFSRGLNDQERLFKCPHADRPMRFPTRRYSSSSVSSDCEFSSSILRRTSLMSSTSCQTSRLT
jgi:hypothetical protein